MSHRFIRCSLAILALAAVARAGADETPGGTLMIIGGALQTNNDAVFERLIAAATIGGRMRIGAFPTAGQDRGGAEGFQAQMIARGVPATDVPIIDLTAANASAQAESSVLAEQIRDCTGIFFAGGDQSRLTRALLRPDGGRTAALRAIDDLLLRGGVIAGSSAGAAVQSEAMIAVAGLPNDSLDDGMDALDFGLTKSIHEPARRGLLVTRGLGFFRGGIIDQHFNQRRGRLSRLARAAIENNVRFGYGIDEDTALFVRSDGSVEVLGPGCVIVVNAAGGLCQDGPLGCSLTGISMSCLEQGDRFDPRTGKATPNPVKKPVPPGLESYNGNFLISDIAARGAIQHALFSGLANNTSDTQVGVTFKHHYHYAHGYRFTFSKIDATKFLEGSLDGKSASSVLDVRLDIEPLAVTLRPPQTALPRDIVNQAARKAIEPIWFRGIMLADDDGLFRPQAAITRGELAGAIAQSIHLVRPRNNPSTIADLAMETPFAAEIQLVVEAGLMDVDGCGMFRPKETISRQSAAKAIAKLAEEYRSAALSTEPVELHDEARISPTHCPAVHAVLGAELLSSDDGRFRPDDDLTRAEAAAAICNILGFSW